MGSGSSGNATFVSSGGTNVLIDAGFSCREIFKRLEEIGATPSGLDAVIITHEHSDHIKGLDVLMKRFGIHLYLTQGTWKAMEKDMNRYSGQVYTFSAGQSFEINDIGFDSFPVLHDAAEPVGFCLHNNGSKLGIATDLGKVTHLVRESLKGSRCLILESNHDPGMLNRGPYPWWLKQRIRGRFGHLSNDDSANLLTDLLHTDLRHVVLAHISQTNNQREMAHINALKVIQKQEYRHIDIQVAFQDRTLKPIEVV
ncbi:MBL fold metallo-hydrolase [bacterium]|nr:MBL fold metallo-hydrolase [bacterium]